MGSWSQLAHSFWISLLPFLSKLYCFKLAEETLNVFELCSASGAIFTLAQSKCKSKNHLFAGLKSTFPLCSSGCLFVERKVAKVWCKFLCSPLMVISSGSPGSPGSPLVYEKCIGGKDSDVVSIWQPVMELRAMIK